MPPKGVITLHIYGTIDGQVVVKYGGAIILTLILEDALDAHRQLGVAIGEAERAAAGQLRLDTPGASTR